MKLNKYLAILSIIVVLSSCSRKYYSNVDAVIAPKIIMPENIKTVTLLDRSKEKNLSLRVGNVVKSGIINSNVTKRFMRNAGNKLPLFTNVYPKSLRHSNAGSPARQMNSEDVSKYAGESDGLFAIELFLFKEVRIFENIRKHQLDENGKDYIIDAVRGTRINTLNTQWRLYDKITGEVIFTLPYNVEEIFEVEGLTEAGANAKLDTLITLTINDLTGQIVNQINVDFNPHQIRSHWMYFKKGDELIKKSGQYIKQGNFKKAIKLLQINQPMEASSKIKIRAIYNLSTSYFLNGQYEKAIEEVKEGLSLYRNKELKQLLKKMEQNYD